MKEISLQLLSSAARAGLGSTVILLLAGCSSRATGLEPTASRVVGAGGGKLEISSGALAGTSLEIPADAVADELTITIDLGEARPSPGYGVIGPAANIGPAALQFASHATLVLPFDTSTIDANTPLAMFLVKIWDGRRYQDLRPLGVNRVQGMVTVALPETGTAWVVLFGRGDPTLLTDYWPMTPGDSYDFDDATTLRILDSDPVLPGQSQRTTELAWTDGIDNWGFEWMRSESGSLHWLGRYGMIEDDRREAIEPQFMCPQMMRVGTRIEQSFPYVYHRFSGRNSGTYFGEEQFVFEVEEQLAEMTVPLGTFRDVIRIRLRTVVGLGAKIESTRFWLARNTGLIQVQTDEETPSAIVNARVGGKQVRPD